MTFLVSIALVPVMAVATESGGREMDRESGPVTVISGPSVQVALAEELTERFERAGLELPDLSITFHPDKADCGGILGHHRSVAAHSRIDVCVGTDADPRNQEYVVAHELAHAWAWSGLDDEVRRDFLALRDLRTWNDDDVAWKLRGSEHAADTVAWGVLGHRGVGLTVPLERCEALLGGYFRLTARFPVAGPGVCDGA